MELTRILEAALFSAGAHVSMGRLQEILNVEKRQVTSALQALHDEFEQKETAMQIEFDDEKAVMQLKPQYIAFVSSLSKVELSRKAMKILALVAKKGEILQSDLHDYFRGDIYEYVAELKEKGYVASEKIGNTKKLKTTSKFREEFQVAIEKKRDETPQPAADNAQQKLEL